jgi:hypothetical protein
MVAVVGAPAPSSSRQGRPRPALALVDTSSARPARPARPARRTDLVRVSPAAYGRRRAVAAGAALVVVAVLVLVFHGLVARVGSGALTAPDRPGAAQAYVVQPGDSFWSVARRLQPHGDPRPLVSRLVAAHGGPVLHPGERIALP